MYIWGKVFLWLLPLVFYAYVCYCLRISGFWQRVQPIGRKDMALSALILLFTVIGGYILLSKNRTIYVWDNARAWSQALYLWRHSAAEGPWHILQTLIRMQLRSSYGAVLPALSAFFIDVAGQSFTAFYLGNMLLFFLPFALLFSLYIRDLAHTFRLSPPPLCFGVGCVALLPSLHLSALSGFADMPVLIFMLLAFILTEKVDFRQKDFRIDLLLAYHFYLIFLMRRFYLYFAVACLFVQCITLGETLFLVKQEERKALCLNFLKRCLLAGSTLVPIVIISALRDYGHMYSAYDIPLVDKFRQLILVFGGIFCLAGLILPLLYIKKSRSFALFWARILLCILVILVLFWSVQRMDRHHYLLLAPLFLLLLVLACFALLPYFGKKVYGFALLLSLANLLCSFTDIAPEQLFFASDVYKPAIRQDIATIQGMVEDMKGYCTEENGKKMYCLASSYLFNSSVLSNAYLPEELWALPALQNTHDVDLRNGFSPYFWRSDYILVADPIQLHLKEGSQETVRYPAELLLEENSYLSRHFRRIKEYTIDGGVKVFLYEKISEYEKEDYEKMRAYFESIYPNEKELFADIIQPENQDTQ